MSQDYYSVLGVDRSSSQTEIKKAYRKIAMKYHPDKNPGDQAAEDRFKEAAEAYDILGDPDKRARYDQFGHSAFQQGGGFHQGGFENVDDIFSSFSDIFSDFFGMGGPQGRGRRRNAARRGADLRYMLEVNLKDVISGLDKDLEFETEDNCGACNGTGSEPGHEPENCPTCGGAGQVVNAQGFFSVATTCPTCNGAGKIIRHPCKACRGKGRRSVSRNITVTIPKGVDTGTRLRVSGEGEGGFRGGSPGDLYVEIRVRDNEEYQRRGKDLYGDLKISYIQALLGADVDVETFDGKKRITIPEASAPGRVVKLSGLGVPDIRGGARGDLCLQLDVEFPKKLKKEEEKLLRQLAEVRGDDVSEKKGFFGR